MENGDKRKINYTLTVEGNLVIMRINKMARRMSTFTASNGWHVVSAACPAIDPANKTIFVWGVADWLDTIPVTAFLRDEREASEVATNIVTALEEANEWM